MTSYMMELNTRAENDFYHKMELNTRAENDFYHEWN